MQAKASDLARAGLTGFPELMWKTRTLNRSHSYPRVHATLSPTSDGQFGRRQRCAEVGGVASYLCMARFTPPKEVSPSHDRRKQEMAETHVTRVHGHAGEAHSWFQPGTTLKCEPGVSPESLRLHAEWYR